MKGMSLPINTLVILVLCLVILLALLALFFGIWTPGVGGVSLQAAKDNACNKLLSVNCAVETKNIMVNNFDADRDGQVGVAGEMIPNTGACGDVGAGAGDNLYMLCTCNYGTTDEDGCKYDVCRCPQ